MDDWKTIGQAGFWGPEREDKKKELNSKYGLDNWRIIHVWGKNGEFIIPWITAVEFYGHAYYEFLKANDEIRNYIRREAKDVYVYQEQKIVSGKQNFSETLDYKIQEIDSTHIQDISIRKAFMNLGIWFEGERLIRVTGGSDDLLARQLSPGKVPFHQPQKIVEPHYINDWINDCSVACYYHSNKMLQVRER